MIWQNTGEPNVNRIIDVSLIETGTEPIDLATAKAYCRAQTGTSEDALFGILITSARQAIEKITGLSLIAKTVDFTAYNPCGHFSILYGPVTLSSLVIKDKYGRIETPETVGYQFPEIVTPYNDWIQVSFTGGYTTDLPSELKMAMLAQINFMYENRGDNSDGVSMCQTASNMCLKYSRIPIMF